MKWIKNMCKHCFFIEKLDNIYKFDEKGYKEKNIKSKQTNELWYYLMTEIFVYLHKGKDYCKFSKLKYKKKVHPLQSAKNYFCHIKDFEMAAKMRDYIEKDKTCVKDAK